MKTKVISVLSVILTCAYPCTFIYFQNVGEGSFHETIFPFCIFIGVAAGILGIGYWFLKKIEKAALFTCLFMLMFMNFNMVNAALLKISSIFQGLYMLIFYLAVYLIFFVYLRKSKWDASVFCAVIASIFGLLIILNGIMAIPDIVKKISFQKNISSEWNETYVHQETYDNIYYFVFDEYGGPLSLEHYYEFENEEFTEFLEDSGFTISKTSYNRESINTVDTLPNVLNLDYVTEIDGASEYNMNYTENPALYQILKNVGYQINLVNHRDALREEGVRVISKFDGNDRMDTITDYILNQSLIYNLSIRLAPERSSISIYAEALLSALNDMKYAWQEVGEQPTLTVCYLQCPHVGFVFDKDGSRIAEEDCLDWEDKSIYIDQVLFLNKWIKETVQAIQVNDPNAIIIMQSDHGVRYAKHCMYLYEEQEYDAELESDYMENILNCVYWGKRKAVDIEGMSGINTWRTVLNVVLGSNYKMLPEPEGYIYQWREVDGIQ